MYNRCQYYVAKYYREQQQDTFVIMILIYVIEIKCLEGDLDEQININGITGRTNITLEKIVN